jgi:hypothetical protein
MALSFKGRVLIGEGDLRQPAAWAWYASGDAMLPDDDGYFSTHHSSWASWRIGFGHTTV